MIGLKKVQFEALFGAAQSASITQADFLETLRRSGAAGVLARCAESGNFRVSKLARSEMDFERMLYQEYRTSTNLFFTCSHHQPELEAERGGRRSGKAFLPQLR